MEKYQVIKPCPLLRSIMWLPIVNMVLKLSKFQSAAISLIMKISRPNCLHLIDLEKLFPMVSSIFALWWAVPKLSAKNRQKSEAKVKFSKFQSVTISLIMKISRPNVLRLIDLEKLFPMLLHFALWWAVQKLSSENKTKLKLEVKFSKFQSAAISLIMKISRPNFLRLIDHEKIFAMVSSIFALWWAVPKLSAWKTDKNLQAKVKFSKFQSVAISLIMKISRPNVLRLIDLEKLFPMVSSIFALWWAVPKLSAKNRQKSEAKVKFSKFQSVTISLIMKISRPNVLRLIDLERLFPMLLPFCTVMSGSKVIIRKQNKTEAGSQIFKISICRHFLNNEDIKTKLSASDRSWADLCDGTFLFTL